MPADVRVLKRYTVLTVVELMSSDHDISSITTPMHGDCPGALKIFPTVATMRMM